jgi:hypothetical protein
MDIPLEIEIWCSSHHSSVYCLCSYTIPAAYSSSSDWKWPGIWLHSPPSCLLRSRHAFSSASPTLHILQVARQGRDPKFVNCDLMSHRRRPVKRMSGYFHSVMHLAATQAHWRGMNLKPALPWNTAHAGDSSLVRCKCDEFGSPCISIAVCTAARSTLNNGEK